MRAQVVARRFIFVSLLFLQRTKQFAFSLKVLGLVRMTIRETLDRETKYTGQRTLGRRYRSASLAQGRDLQNLVFGTHRDARLWNAGPRPPRGPHVSFRGTWSQFNPPDVHS